MGGTVTDDRLEIWTDADDEEFAESVCRQAPKPLVAMGISALEEKKRWPTDRFALVAKHLREKWGAGIVLIGGTGDQALAEAIQKQIEFPVIDMIGRSTLRGTAAILKRCALYVGNDSGPMHIAAAAGASVLTISCHPLDGDPAWR